MKAKADFLNELSELDRKIRSVKSKLAKTPLPIDDDQRKKKERIEKRYHNLVKKRAKLLVKFDTSFRAYLERLDTRYQYRGVVKAIDPLCPGCYIKLPTSEAGRLRRPDQFVICSSCGRVILSQAEAVPA